MTADSFRRLTRRAPISDAVVVKCEVDAREFQIIYEGAVGEKSVAKEEAARPGAQLTRRVLWCQGIANLQLGETGGGPHQRERFFR